jgi:hypothetical protein
MMVLEAFALVAVVMMLQVVSMVKLHEYLHLYCYQLYKQKINMEYLNTMIYLRGRAAPDEALPPPAFKSRKIATARLFAILPNVAN